MLMQFPPHPRVGNGCFTANERRRGSHMHGPGAHTPRGLGCTEGVAISLPSLNTCLYEIVRSAGLDPTPIPPAARTRHHTANPPEMHSNPPMQRPWTRAARTSPRAPPTPHRLRDRLPLSRSAGSPPEGDTHFSIPTPDMPPNPKLSPSPRAPSMPSASRKSISAPKTPPSSPPQVRHQDDRESKSSPQSGNCTPWTISPRLAQDADTAGDRLAGQLEEQTSPARNLTMTRQRPPMGGTGTTSSASPETEPESIRSRQETASINTTRAQDNRASKPEFHVSVSPPTVAPKSAPGERLWCQELSAERLDRQSGAGASG